MTDRSARDRRRVVTSVAVAVALVAGYSQTAAADEKPTADRAALVVEGNGARASLATPVSGVASYSDREVLELLLAGTGTIAKDNPRIVDVLGFAPGRARISDADLREVVDAYRAYNPDFRAEVLPGLTSGSPDLVQTALGEFYESVVDFFKTDPVFAEARTVAGRQPVVSTNATGQAVQNINFVVNVNALLNVNVAAVAVAGAAVFALAYVWTRYLDDPNRLYDVDQANMIREVTLALS